MSSPLRLPVLLATVLVAVAGCGYQAAAPGGPTPTAAPAAVAAPNAVEIKVVCGGAQQVFWHGSWWIDPSSAKPVRGDSFDRIINGTMTQTGPGQAILTSPQLVGSQKMTDSHVGQINQPPLGTCDPL